MAAPSPRGRGGLARGLLLVLLPLSLLPLIILALLAYRQVQINTISQVTDQLSTLAALKDTQINNWAAARAADANNLARSPDLAPLARGYAGGQAGAAALAARLNDFQAANGAYEAVLFAGPDGVVKFASAQSGRDLLAGVAVLDGDELARASQGALLLPPIYDDRVGGLRLMAAAPIQEAGQGSPLGLILLLARPAQLFELVSPSLGLAPSGHSYLVTREGYEIGSDPARPTAPVFSAGIQAARAHLNGANVYADAAGLPVFGAYHWLANYELALIVEESQAEALAPLSQFGGLLVSILASAIVIIVVGAVFVTLRMTSPLQSLAEVAMRMAGGDLTTSVPVGRSDEVGMLAESFNSMSAELRDLYASLENKVEARTQQLATAAEIGRAATSMFSAADLLGRSAELIHDRFGYEHVLIFLLDETGRMAVLSEAAGPSGEALKAIGLRAAVGSESVIGWVTENRQARVVGHTGSETLDAPSGLLAGTRSEATLPLRVGDRLIGALDVHSRAPNAFSAASVEVLQALADQISVALENGRLFARQERVAQLEQRVAGLTARIHSSLTLDAILENAATELGHVFGASKVVVRLKPEAESLLAGPAAAPATTPAAPLPAGKPGNGNGHGLEPNGLNRPAADPTS